MCGIAGVLTSEPINWQTTLRSMADRLRHRGPDDDGIWLDAQAGIGLAHRRLSILDLSAEGKQPMHSASGRYTICYNGEVYNFAELKNELNSSTAFRGGSDTEVLLAAIEYWGLESAVRRCTGMFAFALWDRKHRVLHLVRDRIGEKPLYYGWVDKQFLFASELKAIRAVKEFRAEVDRGALAGYMRYAYVPSPMSIFKGIRKLIPGTIVTLSLREVGVLPEPKPYWTARETVEAGIANPFQGSDAEATEQLDQLLRKSIGRQMIADVPLGAFLSGGIDSSAVVALMQAQSDRPVKTFTIGTDVQAYDESQHAAEVARHLKTEHTELRVTAHDALQVIPRLPELYDEPFADSSQIPTHLVSQLARQHVTVSLSGDGADELFGGYNRHLMGERMWSRLRRLPKFGRLALAGGIKAFSPDRWDAIFKTLGRALPSRFSPKLPGQKLHKLAGIMGVANPTDMYQRLTSQWQSPESIVLGTESAEQRQAWPDLGNLSQEIMLMDLLTYLPGDILTKVDRAAMGVSLETRVPFLDHNVIEFAWTLPLEMKIRQGQGKWVLRQVLDRYVPRSLVERPKSGFGVPIEDWLRGPLRDWAEDLIDENRLRNEGFLNPQPIRKMWAQQLAGTHSNHHQLWTVLMFQAWLSCWKSETSVLI
jgi:asparagine synthase (glutamine-hydrolysing)